MPLLTASASAAVSGVAAHSRHQGQSRRQPQPSRQQYRHGLTAQITSPLRRSRFPVNAEAQAAAEAEAEVPAAEEPAKLKWWQKDMQPNMVDIHTMAQFLEEMASSAKTDQLVIVDFYATWCHACKGLYPKLAKLMAENSDIKLLKIEFDSNKDLCKSLGIKVLPYFHFYRGNEGRLAAFSASLKKIDKLKDAIREHNTPRCILGEKPVYASIDEVSATFEEDDQ